MTTKLIAFICVALVGLQPVSLRAEAKTDTQSYEIGQRWLYRIDGKESSNALEIVGAGIHPSAGAGFDIQLSSLPLPDGTSTTVTVRMTKAALERSTVRQIAGARDRQPQLELPKWDAASWVFDTSVEEVLRTLRPGLEASLNLKCEFDRERMLALDQQAFDQDMEGGWRKLALNLKCLSSAADLIRDYRQHHKNDSPILFWHEGQLRAEMDETREAIALFEKSRKKLSDGGGWNEYVDASIAFLRGDRTAFDAARAALAALPKPKDYDLRDPSGKEVAWPPNLDVIDTMARCFGMPYREAYGRCPK